MDSFDRELHEYRIDGRLVPSVSEIVGRMYDFSHVSGAVLSAAAHRGTMVHEACELWDRGCLDESTLDERLVPYLDGWKAFCADHLVAWIPEYMETPMFHHDMLYGGTPDRVGMIGDHLTIIDIKITAKISPVAGIQLAGYNLLLQHVAKSNADRLGVVRLKKDGTYEKVWFNDAAHESAFRALRAIRNWEGRWLK